MILVVRLRSLILKWKGGGKNPNKTKIELLISDPTWPVHVSTVIIVVWAYEQDPPSRSLEGFSVPSQSSSPSFSGFCLYLGPISNTEKNSWQQQNLKFQKFNQSIGEKFPGKKRKLHLIIYRKVWHLMLQCFIIFNILVLQGIQNTALTM